MDIQGNIAQAEASGMKVGIIPVVGGKSGKYMADTFTINGIAISAKSRNWERTLMAMDLIIDKPRYENLVYFGIEGKNYVVKDGKIALPDGVTDDQNTYPPDAAGFWFTNKNLHKPLASWTPSYVALHENLPNLLGTNLLAALSINTDNFKTEAANCNQILTQ